MPQKCVLEINLSLGRSAEEELHFSWAMASIFQTCGIQMPVWTEHSPSWGRHTHTPHKNRFTSQNKPSLECRSFPVDAVEHEVLPRCAWCHKMLPCRNKDQLIPWNFPLCSLWGSSRGDGGTACWELLIAPNSTSQGNPGPCTPSSQGWKHSPHTPNCHWIQRKWELWLGPICKFPIKRTEGTELSLVWAHSELANQFFGK